MNLKVNDNSIQKLSVKKDEDLARIFLKKKSNKKITYETLSNDSLKIREMQNPDNTVKYPYYCSLAPVERAFFLVRVLDRYFALVRDPKVYELNLESVISVYENLLADNWITFEQERMKADAKAKEKGVERDFTSEYNAELCRKIVSLVISIDLSKVNSLEI